MAGSKQLRCFFNNSNNITNSVGRTPIFFAGAATRWSSDSLERGLAEAATSELPKEGDSERKEDADFRQSSCVTTIDRK